MVPRGETVIVASSFEQARIAFEHVVAFMGDKLADKAGGRSGIPPNRLALKIA